MDTLEYIHSNGYVHSDIKGMNMVLGETYPAPVYLLDFGLASKFAYRNGVHKEYRMDGRKADAGTLEFSSRDAHIGGKKTYLFIAIVIKVPKY
jgi:vaccinia related kinase